MKKKYLATVVFAAFSIPTVNTYAQSNVTVYGRVDAGVEYISNANLNKDGMTRLSSGAMNTSRIGFRGTEDLGGGLKAVFQLESGFKADTGEQDDPEFFKRQANVGLEGKWGRLIAGRSYTTTYDFILPFDPMGYSASYSWITSAGATGARKDGMVTNLGNMLKYAGKFGDFKLGGTYSFGEVAGSTSDSAKLDLGAGYERGPLRLATTIQRANGTANGVGVYDKTTVIHLAGDYKINNDWTVDLGYRNYKKTLANNAPDLRSNFYWSGFTYRTTPALTLIAVLSYQDIRNVVANTDADPYMLSLRAKYALSKRTDLYLSAAYAKAKNRQLVGLSRDDIAYGNSQTGIVSGIQHRF